MRASSRCNPSNKCNGMTYDAAGNLYVCEHVTSALVMETPAGERKVLATHWQGKELNSPNDVVLQSDATIYFTDPTYGRTAMFGRERKPALDFARPSTALHPMAGCTATRMTSPSRTGCASPPTSGPSTSTIPSVRTSAPSRSPLTDRLVAAGCSSAGRHGQLRRRGRRRHEVRRTGQRLRHRPARHLGDRPPGTASGRHRHAGGRRESELGWAGLDNLYCACSTSLYRVRMKVHGNPVASMRMA